MGPVRVAKEANERISMGAGQQSLSLRAAVPVGSLFGPHGLCLRNIGQTSLCVRHSHLPAMGRCEDAIYAQKDTELCSQQAFPLRGGERDVLYCTTSQTICWVSSFHEVPRVECTEKRVQNPEFMCLLP